MKAVRFIAPFIVVSFFISLLLLIGRIDQDFFAFYYGGRILTEGRDLYANITENKGPVTYWFFALVYWLFGHHYGAAILLVSTITDAINSAFLYLLVQKWLRWRPPHRKYIRWGISAALVIYLKSFSINTLQGGIYSEQIGLSLLLLSLFLIEKRRLFTAGMSFGFALLTRQSFIGYLLFIFVRLLARKISLIRMSRFLIGMGGIGGGFILLTWLNGQWAWTFENMILTVWWHSRAIASEYWRTVLITVVRETRLLFAGFFAVAFLIRYRGLLVKKHILYSFLALFVSGIVSVFGGGLVWDHHFLQLAPVFVLCFFAAVPCIRKDYLLQFCAIMLICCVIVGYAGYMLIGSRIGYRLVDVLPSVPEIAQKRFMVAYPFYPRLYIDYDKTPPDRYFDPSFSFNQRLMGEYAASLAISRHLIMDKAKISDTAFVFISDINYPAPQQQWYLDLVREPFGLEKTAEYAFGLLRMEIYASSKK